MDKEGFAGKYDFLYLPIESWLRPSLVGYVGCGRGKCPTKDFRSKASLGYAFVNLVDENEAPGHHGTK